MPGIFASQTNGVAHQIWRERAITASAPPYCWPSDISRWISRIRWSWDRPRSGATRGSCNGARAKPRRSRTGAMARAIFVQNLQSASKKSQPLAWRDLVSVYSLAREIMLCASEEIGPLLWPVAAKAGPYNDENKPVARKSQA